LKSSLRRQLVLLLFASAAFAQTPNFRVETRMVEVPVVVRDKKTGRPVENSKLVEYSDGRPRLVFPSGVGGHNFNPMSLSPKTGLVYIPTAHTGSVLTAVQNPGPRLPQRSFAGVQIGFANMLENPQALPPAIKPLADPAFLKTQPTIKMSASLKAWDPVQRKVVWSAPPRSCMDHGRVTSTGGGLVIQGGLDGVLRVYRDTDGTLLKEITVGTPMIAAPAALTPAPFKNPRLLNPVRLDMTETSIAPSGFQSPEAYPVRISRQGLQRQLLLPGQDVEPRSRAEYE
jgi:hypothetical protein